MKPINLSDGLTAFPPDEDKIFEITDGQSRVFLKKEDLERIIETFYKKEMKYEYFVSYDFSKSNQAKGRGNTTFTAPEKIKTHTGIRQIEDYVAEEGNYANVTLSNFILLNETED